MLRVRMCGCVGACVRTCVRASFGIQYICEFDKVFSKLRKLESFFQ